MSTPNFAGVRKPLNSMHISYWAGASGFGLPAFLFLLFAAYCVFPAEVWARTGEWVWQSGSNAPACADSGGFNMCFMPGVYGTQGTGAAGNVPGSRVKAATWTDAAGNLWLLGGYAADAGGNFGYMNDLWEFLPHTNQWVWVAGSSTVEAIGSQGDFGQVGVYGELGIADAANIPGGREGAITWVDVHGRAWLFGGWGFDADGVLRDLNDLWVFDPATGLWTWIGGSKSLPCPNTYFCMTPGSYGSLGTPAAGNIPGPREGAVSWTDGNGELWLFGGFGVDAAGARGELNDLWRFDPAGGMWTWISGSSTVGSSFSRLGVYGSLGVPAAANTPGGRYYGASWTDAANRLWLFGGVGSDSANAMGGFLNDLWVFDQASRLWTWMAGSSTLKKNGDPYGDLGSPGVYGTLGVRGRGNTPGGRVWPASWSDPNGKFWLFGGYQGRANTGEEDLNDLWTFDPASREWTWMGGSNGINQQGSYGTFGVPAPANMPGARNSTMSWADATGHLWLFGGARSTNISSNVWNDLWEFAPPGVVFKVSDPVIDPAPGHYSSVQMVTLTDGTPGATIHYTLNGSKPNANSPVYSTPIYIGGKIVLKAVAMAPGYVDSNMAVAVYDVTLPSAPAPVISPGPGKYVGSVTVTIADNTPDASIHYTLDGSTPVASSPLYTGPITLTKSTMVRAIATAPGYWKSGVVQTFFSVPPRAPTPVIKPQAGSYAPGQPVTISDAIAYATIRYTTDGSLPTVKSPLYTHALALTGPTTVQAIAIATNQATSLVSSAVYTIAGP